MGPKYRGKRNWIIDLSIIGGSIVLFVVSTNLAVSKRVLSSYFGNIAFAYEDYGYPYCLAVTLFDTGISQPNGYSESLIAEIVDSEGQPESSEESERPNIIFLQLESFFDPELVNFLKHFRGPHSLLPAAYAGIFFRLLPGFLRSAQVRLIQNLNP